MGREWMTADRMSDEYDKGVDEFVHVAKNYARENREEFVYCPCRKCWNAVKVRISDLKNHLVADGIDPTYKVWKWHGEDVSSTAEEDHNVESYVDDDEFVEMLQNIEYNFSKRPDILESLSSGLNTPLYPGCTKFNLLCAVLKLYNLKAGNGWSDKSFTALLELLKEMLPEGNDIPTSTYEAKKLLCPMGTGFKKIHACPNDCILYQNEHLNLQNCPRCDASRYKPKKNKMLTSAPAKVLWYLPIIPRFKRLFANSIEAKNLRWHADERICDGKLRHPADSPQWKTIDFMFPEFGKEARNHRLGFATDGMNPHGNLSSSYSIWPVFLVIYNLPPWLCMKRKYIMLSLLISGPRQPGNDIDVFLRPLIDDLKKLWVQGVQTFDAYREESFTLRAMIFCTINDFPAYGNLSGYTVKGHKACPVCEENTCSFQLKHGRKTVYMNHRRFLSRDHPYRKMKKAFNGFTEEERAPILITGTRLHEKVKNINVQFGKPYKASNENKLWKKRSIFFDLPYWEFLFVRHCIDVMHVESNDLMSVLGTLFNMTGKSKDGVNSRLDMVDMGIRKELALEKRGQRMYLPPACYTLSRKEKITFCECLYNIKVPQGYSSNIRNLVSMKDLKLVGMKSHDCHVMMQQILPVAIRSILLKKVRHTLTRLCFFFNTICSKVIDPTMLDDLQKEVVIILCQLEMYFPPSFFDIMVHLIIHLVKEVQSCGPVYFRWMYPFERSMKVLKGYVRNRSRPEGCIIESYIAEEILDFCNDYLRGATKIGLPKSRHKGRIEGKGLFGLQVVSMTNEQRNQAHLYILHNIEEVQPYIDEHIDLIRKQYRGKTNVWVQSEHNRTFVAWFEKRVSDQLKEDADSVSDTIRWLAPKPDINVLSYSGYDINGYTFYTKDQDNKSTMQNSGVTLVAQAMHVSSSKDRNPISASMSYYGIIKKIWELVYVELRIPVFCCKWVDNYHGVQVDELGFTLVDLNREGHRTEPFIMASQAKQVFYVADPSNEKFSVVLQGKKQITGDEDDYDTNIDEIPSFSLGIPPVNLYDSEIDVQDVYVRDDHTEGILM